MSHPSDDAYEAWSRLRTDITRTPDTRTGFAAGWEAAGKGASPYDLVYDVAVGLVALDMPVLSARDPREVFDEMGDKKDLYISKARFLLGFAVR